jgi:membrane fusion protein (multidrug efflux system)
LDQTEVIDRQREVELPGAFRQAFLRRWRWPLILVGPIVIVLVVGYVMLTGRRYEATDNAYVQIAKTPVSPSVAGRVIEIYVKENQAVRRGQLLFRMDSRDLQTSAAAAAAQLAQAEQQVLAQRAALAQTHAAVAAARASVSYAMTDAGRQRELAAAGVASQAQVDLANNAVRQARQQLAVAEQQSAQAVANLGGAANGPVSAHPAVMLAQAQLQRARLNLTYTDVVAPADGVVTRVEQMPAGTYVNASQTVFWLLTGRPWVEANFKEDQLAHMKVGQSVSIRVDAYPDVKLTGKVASFSPGTGSAFSVLPAQNATGNWVKVVQRLPVRVDFDRPPPGMAARAGLSARVKVDVRAPGAG